jgi:hypothetical protein
VGLDSAQSYRLGPPLPALTRRGRRFWAQECDRFHARREDRRQAFVGGQYTSLAGHRVSLRAVLVHWVGRRLDTVSTPRGDTPDNAVALESVPSVGRAVCSSGDDGSRQSLFSSDLL